MVGDPDRIELIALHLKCRVPDIAIAENRPAIRLGDRQHDSDFHSDSSTPICPHLRSQNMVPPTALYVARSENAKMSRIVDQLSRSPAGYNRLPEVLQGAGPGPDYRVGMGEAWPRCSASVATRDRSRILGHCSMRSPRAAR